MSTEDDSTTVIEFLHGGAPAPVLPNNAVESMLAGIPVPPLPGIEDLFAPLIELGKSLGTGTFAGIDPVGIFNQASTLIDHAMGLSQSAVAEVGQTWNSTGSEAATELSRSAQNSGAELSERGTAISKTAAAAAESVQRGNANLAAIAQSFATTVAAAAPIAWTPPGQAMLLASAAEHMQAAVASVTRTRGEMLGHTAAMNALAGSIPVPTPPTSEALSNLVTPEAINNAARQIAQPLSASTDAGDAYSTHQDSTQPGTDAVRTSAAQAGAGLATGVDKLWGAGNSSTSLTAGGSPSPSATTSSGGAWVGGSGTIGGIARGAAGVTAAQPVPIATPGPGAPSSAAANAGMSPGGMLGGGPRGSRDDESSRTTPGYLVTAGDENSMVDDLPMVSPPVLGAENPDQYLFRDL